MKSNYCNVKRYEGKEEETAMITHASVFTPN